jgi:hypothetical protein
MSIETNCSLLINKYKKRKSTLDPVQKKLGQLKFINRRHKSFLRHPKEGQSTTSHSADPRLLLSAP